MRIAIIGGAGRVGSQIAFSLASSTIPVEQLQLYDVVESVKGEAKDLQQAMRALGKKTRVRAAALEECSGADVVIFVAGLPLSKAGTLDRNQLAGENAKILQGTLGKLADPRTVYIIVTNPVDVMTYLAAKIIGDRHRVLGVSTLTDTVRLEGAGYLIGEHGGHMVHIGGQEDIETVKQSGLEVVKLKGGTWFTVGSIIRRLVSAVANDERALLPVSCSLRGEFGFSDLALSVPCIVGRGGIMRVETVSLDKQQREVLQRAAESLRGVISSVA